MPRGTVRRHRHAHIAGVLLALGAAGAVACREEGPTGAAAPSTRAAASGAATARTRAAPGESGAGRERRRARAAPGESGAGAAAVGLPHVVMASTYSVVSGQWKQATAQCPDGERATGGGYFFLSETSLTDLMVSRNQPWADASGTPIGWIVKLRAVGALNAVSGKWVVFVNCLPAR